MQVITLPAKRSRIPGVPKWEVVQQFLARCARRRDKAMLALMVYGWLRRAEVVRLNIGDYQPQFGLRRVLGKGGHETAVPLPSGGNLRAVQEHLRHVDIQTTTLYTRLAPQDLQKVVNLFDEDKGGPSP